MSKHYSTTFWFGILIGALLMLLATALAIIFIPKLRPIVGIEANNVTNAPVAAPNTTPIVPPSTTMSDIYNDVVNEAVDEPIVSTENAAISVTEPEPNKKVGNPLIIRGEARVFENTVSLRVRDENGDVLAEAFTNAAAPDIGEFGEFEISLIYKSPRGTVGTVEVFENSAKDGSEINKVSIPIRFK